MCPHVLMGPIFVSVISACWEIQPIMPLCLTSMYNVASLPLQPAILTAETAINNAAPLFD